MGDPETTAYSSRRGQAASAGGLGDDVLRVTSTAVGRGPNGYAVNTPCLGYGSAVRAVHVDLLSAVPVGKAATQSAASGASTAATYGDVIRGSDLPDSIEGGAGRTS